MASTPYPLPRQSRESSILVGNGSVGPYGPTTFKVFDILDIEIWAKATGEVQKKLKVYAGMVMDRTGHRFAGPAILQPGEMDNGMADFQQYNVVAEEGEWRLLQRWVATHQKKILLFQERLHA